MKEKQNFTLVQNGNLVAKRHLSVKPLKNTAIHKMKNIKARQIDELQFPNYN